MIARDGASYKLRHTLHLAHHELPKQRAQDASRPAPSVRVRARVRVRGQVSSEGGGKRARVTAPWQCSGSHQEPAAGAFHPVWAQCLAHQMGKQKGTRKGEKAKAVSGSLVTGGQRARDVDESLCFICGLPVAEVRRRVANA